MPSRAAEIEAAVEFGGTVCSGLGEGSRFTTLAWVSEEFQRKLGFVAWPGTLNLRMSGAAWRDWRASWKSRPGVAITPAPGFCAAKCFAVVLNGRLQAAAVIPEVDAYPADKLELVAPLALRAALGLADGDTVHVRLDGG